MDRGTFITGTWESPPVLRALTFWQRWKGLRPAAAGRALLMKSGSAHGFGMKEPLLVVALDAGGRVLACRILRPGRLVWLPNTAQLLELPGDHPRPPVGALLTWVGGGPPDPLCNADRQPG